MNFRLNRIVKSKALPIYTDKLSNSLSVSTLIRRIDGDLPALCVYLSSLLPAGTKIIPNQHLRQIRLSGNHSRFLKEHFSHLQ